METQGSGGSATDSTVDDPADLLAEARERTLAIVAGLDRADLDRVVDPIMSPIAWDLGHIAAFEDLWLVNQTSGSPLLRDDLAEVYDASLSPRSDRPDLPWLRSDDAFTYLEAVRSRALDSLAGEAPPNADLIELVVRHEHQHAETILQTIQLGRMTWEPDLPEPASEAAETDCAAGGLEMVGFDGGCFTLGADPDGFAYDNERPAHGVTLAPFLLGRTPVLNGEWQQFIDDGGYGRDDLWTPEGLAWLRSTGAVAPGGWIEGGEWRAGRLEPIDPLRPVIHICCHEAEAFARMHGARLPTEAEWEFAARASMGSSRANLDSLARGPRRIPAGDGALAMIGDVWEWTASEFTAYPGFQWHPYREYSEPHFDSGFRVLRGGSWATRRRVSTVTFRNWDLTVRRQVFAGARIARDPM